MWIFVIQITIWMHGASVSSDQVAMITYPFIVRRERFFAHMAVQGTVKFLPIISRKIYNGDISRQDSIYIMR